MIEVNQLGKRFALGDPKAAAQEHGADPRQRGRFFYSVESVSFSCPPGAVLGLVGPNGAGKTTTLRMLSGVLTPDSGSIRIDGQDLHQGGNAVRAQVGFLSGTTALYERLSVAENLTYFGRLYGLSPAQCQERIELLSEQLGMTAYLKRRVKELSTGMRQRANIARAVVHDPKVIILDEPTTGLDIMSTETVLGFIAEQKAAGRPVIFSTHHLDEVSLLCDQLAVILLGNSVYSGALEGFAGSRDSDAIRKEFMRRHHETEGQQAMEEVQHAQADLA
ncbi:ABC transporter ATP-binding protein [Ferrimonas marina]|uniref:Sodium transport system ATP-binding protein n=1 Tax=Ferrimonas marina TaxID=299255 RepID=A0A1M5Z4X4_9GAMM|nr:ATP-binding cassette domain-containing protein [Ferrimonas marina]SHI18933.1 sodium transport system ATP-binding protein [Ferrimonas marina]